MSFKQLVKNTFNEWKDNGFCQAAVDLNKAIGQDYFDTASPGFFAGDIEAKLVLVHLNPKRDEIDKKGRKLWGQKCEEDFDTYWERHVHFGKLTFGKDVENRKKSSFDLKQTRFLNPFGFFDFNKEPFHDLEEVMEKKLQLELVPFGSPNFDFNVVGIDNIEHFIRNLLEIITVCERKYIIFCGKVFKDFFQKIFEKYIIEEKTHKFYLTTQKGERTKRTYDVINIKLQYDKKEIITACIAPQFAQFGCPIARYGEKVHELYGKFD